MDRKRELDAWRTAPLYSISDAARLAGVHPTTVRRWLLGDEHPGRRMRPVFRRQDKAQDRADDISFLELAEIVIVGRFRKRGVKLDRLRRAHSFARERFGIEYPFARLSLKTDGVHVLHKYEEEEPGTSLLVLDQFGQLTLPGFVAEALETFEFEQDLASRWFPEGRGVPIVVDPRFGAGRPTIPERRLTIDIIYRRWKAGQSMKFIADDFRLQPSVVEEALRFAEKYAA